MKFWIALVAASTALRPVGAAPDNSLGNAIDLSTQKWTLTSPQHPDIQVDAKIPSHAHVDLYNACKITDPISGLNDFDLRWIAYSNWTYSANVAGLRKDRTLHSTIVFNGLDTFAAVEFCGQHIANTDNQFRQYAFDISEALWDCRQKDPMLTVKFGATPNISQAIADLPGQEKWPDETICEVYEFPNRQYIRKEQSDFGWDWGPAMMPVGIWQPARIVQLQFLTSLHVKNWDFDLYRRGQLNSLAPDQNANWIFNASIDLIGKAPGGSTMRYTILHDDTGKQVSHGELGSIKNSGDVITGVTELDKSKYELWWPNGLGAQKLYKMKVDIVWGGVTILSLTKRMGFRTIVLNMEPISQKQLSEGIINGNNWHFEINGREFYAKGSNFVPPDVFWPRVTRDHLKSILTSVVEGNQNMLRVWSSGAYAPDDFYDLADEMGVMLWSEFQFSVSLYPVNPEFLENVRQEAVYNVRRINHHPSLAVWAGGNEMEKDELPIIRDKYKDQYPRYLAEYYELFLNTLLPAVYGNSRSIGYMPCSTNNGYEELNFDLAIPWVNRLYNTTPGYLYGDSDHYNYDAAQGFDVDTYLVGRFANEFGFPAMPSLEGWREAIPESELRLYSKMTLLRNHHYPAGSLATDNYDAPRRGTDEMVKAVKLWYPEPNKDDSVANFSAWCHSTQVYQADFYRNKIQYYRASSGLPQRQLGALYWQLNDIWQAPSWSSMEYSGRWKMMFYATKDIFKPVIVAPVWNVTDGILTIFVVSDQLDAVSGEATWKWIGYDGQDVKAVVPVTKEFTVGAVNATVLAEINVNDLKAKHDFPADNAVLVASIKATGKGTGTSGVEATKTFEHSNFFTATPLSKAKLVDPGLEVQHKGDRFVVTATKGVSVFTWLAPPPSDAGVIVVFEDNGFLLQKGESRQLTYRVVKGDSPGWEGRVAATSIWDNTLSTAQ